MITLNTAPNSRAKIIRKNNLLVWLIAFTALTTIYSCQKENAPAPAGNPDLRLNINNSAAVVIPSTDTVLQGPGVVSGTISYNSSVYHVKNFSQAYSPTPGQPADGNFYFLLTENTAGSSTDYDLKFTGVATGDITSDGTLKYVNKAFSSVVLADYSSALIPAANTIGPNNTVGAPSGVVIGNGKGWYVYTWVGHTVTPVPNRTLLLQKDGNTFKIEIISIYLNGIVGGSFPYYTFKYQQL